MATRYLYKLITSHSEKAHWNLKSSVSCKNKVEIPDTMPYDHDIYREKYSLNSIYERQLSLIYIFHLFSSSYNKHLIHKCKPNFNFLAIKNKFEDKEFFCRNIKRVHCCFIPRIFSYFAVKLCNKYCINIIINIIIMYRKCEYMYRTIQ
ncbi:hypothetical protein C0J52_26629 [Blattella germanica]|nr:hypothetical protein C0J52_26629 [Blattella germanica]